jgi:hypothetical protein
MADQEPFSVWKQHVETRAAQAGKRVRDVAHTVQDLADDFRKDGATAMLADFTERGAQAIDRAGAYLEESEYDTLLTDVEDYSRDHPVVVAAAGVALGVAISRVIKATAARRSSHESAPRSPRRAASSKAAKPRRPRAKKTADAS